MPKTIDFAITISYTGHNGSCFALCCKYRRDQNSIVDNCFVPESSMGAITFIRVGLAKPQEINITTIKEAVIMIKLGVMAKHHASNDQLFLVNRIVVDNYSSQGLKIDLNSDQTIKVDRLDPYNSFVYY